ncbi:SH3 domain-containing protein [Paracoccus sp. 08]|uniref:SH3 domain-containing protein n=1 Tax=Paracoccus sp. 08 TaxID=2606624 RepID=UPI0020961243|nr:SH3 domain-containing protein [Paracoccus sp. 08]MCO6361231.1 SH3 domain-containing protein [Paracoccus sp. 08]
MIRLGLLMLVTLLGVFMTLDRFGQGDLRTERRPEPATRASAATDAGAPSLTAPAQRFPGPPLEPSPEYAGATPEAAQVVPADGPVLYVTADRVNMRAGAGTDNPVVASLTGGSAVQALGPTGGEWVQVQTAEGRQGFVSAQFLTSDAP